MMKQIDKLLTQCNITTKEDLVNFVMNMELYIPGTYAGKVETCIRPHTDLITRDIISLTLNNRLRTLDYEEQRKQNPEAFDELIELCKKILDKDGEITEQEINNIQEKQEKNEQNTNTTSQTLQAIYKLFHANNDSTIEYNIIQDLLINQDIPLDKIIQHTTKEIQKLLEHPEKQTTIPIIQIAPRNTENTIEQTINKYHEYIQQLKQPNNTNKENILIHDPRSTEATLIDKQQNTIYRGTINPKQTNQLKGTVKTIINAYPTKLTVYDDQITKTPTIYHATWKWKQETREIKGTLPETIIQLRNMTGIHNKNLLADTINIVYHYMKENNQAKIIHTPQQKGIYYDKQENTIITVDYNPPTPTPEQVQKALQTIKDLTKYTDKTKLATTIRWSLIAPYQYMIKQQGGKTKYLYLYGVSGCGKTTIYGQIPLKIWDLNHNEENYESGAAGTEAQIRNVYKRSTFPQLYDDTEAILNRKTSKAQIKTAATSIYTKTYTDPLTHIQVRPPALASIVFTSNYPLPDTDNGAFIERFIQIQFTKYDRPTKTEEKQYMQEFHARNNEKNKLNNLKYIGPLFHEYIKENPTKLQGDATQQVNNFLQNIWQQYMNEDAPEWLYNEIEKETYNDYDYNEKETIQEYIIKEINKARGRITLQEESALSREDLMQYELKEALIILGKQRTPSWLIYKKPYGSLNESIFITKGLERGLYAEGIVKSLQDIALLFEWHYTQQRNDKKREYGCRIPLSKFITDVYGEDYKID